MNIKRAFLVLAAVLLLPGLAMAGHSTATYDVRLNFNPNTGAPETTANIQCTIGVPIADAIANLGNNDLNKPFDPVTYDAQGIDVCVVTVVAVEGYTPTYTATVSSGAALISGGINSPCSFQPGEDAQEFSCAVVMNGTVGTFKVTKNWANVDVGGDSVDGSYSMELACDKAIIGTGGTSVVNPVSDTDLQGNDTRTWTQTTTSTLTFIVDVSTTGILPNCWATEDVADSSVESDGNCGSREIGLGGFSECVITNTVFFEGIPTLNQYGLAIMALLMLGVGFVGFRRFV
ncbi:MAG: IPTL-CTERM sorting domain-containing protein [Proteobacteria bacterium]|nr:IPTL-CTERM sorting domain-containing protein [Pseudomonadota bacterium]